MDLLIGAIGTMVSVLGLVLTSTNRFLEKKIRAFFVAFFAVFAVYVIAITARFLINDNSEETWAVVSRIVFFVQAFMSSVLTVMLTAFLLYHIRVEKWWRKTSFLVAAGLWIIYVGLLIINCFSGFIYSVDALNRYTRGPCFYVIMIAPVLLMIVNLVLLTINRNKLSVKQRYAFAAYIVLPMVAMVVQGFVSGINVILISSIVAALIMFAYIVSDQTEKFYTQQMENAQLKIDILSAQIQPHFISNSLGAIRHLFKSDPEKAEIAMQEFTVYLRHNMESLTTDHPIPFEEEMNHVRAYLDLQIMRFGDELQVEYDLDCMDFKIPTLTLQPLVENAVAYGIRRSESGMGVVTISSRRVQDAVEVSVKDDGPGFEYELLDGDMNSHTGIRNVRERLKRISNGELLIDSVIGQGTVVTIRLPDEID